MLSPKSTIQKKKRTRKRVDHQVLEREMIARIPRGLAHRFSGKPCDQEYFGFADSLVMSGASPFLVRDYRMNSGWQPVPGGLTGTMSMYTSSAIKYAIYRCLTYFLGIAVSNNELFRVGGYVIFSDTQPSTLITSYALAVQYAKAAYACLQFSLGYATGQGRFDTLRRPIKQPIAEVVGNPLDYYASDNYAGTLGRPLIAVPVAGTNPAQTVWASLVVYSDGPGMNLTNGVFLDWESYTRTFLYSLLINA